MNTVTQAQSAPTRARWIDADNSVIQLTFSDGGQSSGHVDLPEGQVLVRLAESAGLVVEDHGIASARDVTTRLIMAFRMRQERTDLDAIGQRWRMEQGDRQRLITAYLEACTHAAAESAGEQQDRFRTSLILASGVERVVTRGDVQNVHRAWKARDKALSKLVDDMQAKTKSARTKRALRDVVADMVKALS